MSSSKRHFTAIIGKKEQGSYVSSSPSSAARKAVSKLCADDKKRKVIFSIRETTQKSNKKIYGPYIGYMQKLDKPVELKGRVIRYKPVAKLDKKLSAKKGGIKQNGGHSGGLNLANHLDNKNKNNNNLDNNNAYKGYWFHKETRINGRDLVVGKVYDIRPKHKSYSLSLYKVIDKDDDMNLIKLAKLKRFKVHTNQQPKILTIRQDAIYGYEYVPKKGDNVSTYNDFEEEENENINNDFEEEENEDEDEDA